MTQQSSRTVYCNPAKSKMIGLRVPGAAPGKYFSHRIFDVSLYPDKRALSVTYDTATKSIHLRDNVIYKSFNIPCDTFDRVKIWGGATEAPRGFSLQLESGKAFVVDFHSIRVERRPKFEPSRRTFVRRPAVKAKTTDYTQDPLSIKKSKYRHATKAFGTKRSDAARSAGSQVSRYHPLHDVSVDAKWSRSYMTTHKTLNYLAGKLGMSMASLQAQLAVARMTQGNPMTSFTNGLVRRVVHVLVSSGFFSNYTAATSAVNAGGILVNGQIISDANLVLNVGDVISIHTTAGSKVHATAALRPYDVHSLSINWDTFSIAVLNFPSIGVQMAATMPLTTRRFGDLKGPLSDPLVGIMLRLVPGISR